LFNKLKRTRRKDVNLNIGISDVNGDLDFYVMSSSTLNTFNRESAEKFIQEGYKIQSIQKVQVETISHVLDRHFDGTFPNFLSIDIEGEEERVLRDIDYERNGPIVICVETISFSNNGRGIKNKEVIDFLLSKGYIMYADTYINSIFVKRDRWER
jgi:FkbM family methyltransferase